MASCAPPVRTPLHPGPHSATQCLTSPPPSTWLLCASLHEADSVNRSLCFAQYLYDVYGPLFQPLLVAGQEILSALAAKHSSSLLYPNNLLPWTWLTSRESRPSVPYMASCAVSLPLIGLVQMCQYMVTARIQQLTPDQMTSTLKGATGHSQGVVTAAVIAMGGATWDDYIKNAQEGLKVLFAIGLRG